MERNYRPLGTKALLTHWSLIAVVYVAFVAFIAVAGQSLPFPRWVLWFFPCFGAIIVVFGILGGTLVRIRVDREGIRFRLPSGDFGQTGKLEKKDHGLHFISLGERHHSWEGLRAYGFQTSKKSQFLDDAGKISFWNESFFLRYADGTEWTYRLSAFSGWERADLLEAIRRASGVLPDPEGTRMPVGIPYSENADFWKTGFLVILGSLFGTSAGLLFLFRVISAPGVETSLTIRMIPGFIGGMLSEGVLVLAGFLKSEIVGWKGPIRLPGRGVSNVMALFGILLWGAFMAILLFME